MSISICFAFLTAMVEWIKAQNAWKSAFATIHLAIYGICVEGDFYLVYFSISLSLYHGEVHASTPHFNNIVKTCYQIPFSIIQRGSKIFSLYLAVFEETGSVRNCSRPRNNTPKISLTWKLCWNAGFKAKKCS